MKSKSVNRVRVTLPARLRFGLPAVVALSLFLALCAGSTVQAQSVTPLSMPSGFVDEVVIAGLLAPRAAAFTPDGRILVLERGSAATNDQNTASVRVFKNGQLLPDRALTLDVCGDSERGLLGITPDPDFATNGFVYLYYTRQASQGAACAYNYHPDQTGLVGPRNRVARFIMTGDTIDPASEVVLIDGIVTSVGYHNAGDLHFGQDGYLYISTGEGGISSLSATSDNLNGKILRILPSKSPGGGYSTAGNPFDTVPGARLCGVDLVTFGNGTCREVYAYGLRNPFRFTVRPGTDDLYVGDVGGGLWEEINELKTGGGNYGWPEREGFCSNGAQCSPPYTTPPAYSDPLYAYPHVDAGANVDSAIIGGAFYTGTVGGQPYPAQYADNYFFADFVRGFIRRMVPDPGSDAWSVAGSDFATGGSNIVGLIGGADGNLYYLSAGSDQRDGELRRIRFAGSENQAPFARLNFSPGGGPIETVFTYSALGSFDPDQNVPLTYTWDFGDGSGITTSVLTVTHVYTATGAKSVTLTVTDRGTPPRVSPTAHGTVFPGDEPPTATIKVQNLTELGRQRYFVGDTWEFEIASASSDVVTSTWKVDFHHSDHSHPFLPSPPPEQRTFVTNYNESEPDVWYRVWLTVADTYGQETRVYSDVLPALATLRFDTEPSGLSLSIGEQQVTAPVEITRVVGVDISVTAPLTQPYAGQSYYSFRGWSDGGDRQHVISTPNDGGEVVAAYRLIITEPFEEFPEWSIYLPALSSQP